MKNKIKRLHFFVWSAKWREHIALYKVQNKIDRVTLYNLQNKEGVSLCRNCKIKESLLLYIKCKIKVPFCSIWSSKYRFLITLHKVQSKEVVFLCMKCKNKGLTLLFMQCKTKGSYYFVCLVVSCNNTFRRSRAGGQYVAHTETLNNKTSFKPSLAELRQNAEAVVNAYTLLIYGNTYRIIISLCKNVSRIVTP